MRVAWRSPHSHCRARRSSPLPRHKSRPSTRRESVACREAAHSPTGFSHLRSSKASPPRAVWQNFLDWRCWPHQGYSRRAVRPEWVDTRPSARNGIVDCRHKQQTMPQPARHSVPLHTPQRTRAGPIMLRQGQPQPSPLHRPPIPICPLIAPRAAVPALWRASLPHSFSFQPCVFLRVHQRL